MTETQDTTKLYPAATPQIAQMFGMPLEGANKESPLPETKQASVLENSVQPKVFEQIAGNLFIKTSAEDPGDVNALGNHKNLPVDSHHIIQEHPALEQKPAMGEVITDRILDTLKAVTPYVAVFSAALLVYFYFFSGNSLDFAKIFQPAPQAVATPKENTLALAEKQDTSGYQTWISQFYYDVSDPKVLDPNADNSGNGLSNFQKYLLNLNPKSYDTLGLGMADSQALNQGTDPLTGSQLTDDQKSIIAKYIDMEVVMNRLALANLQKNGEVAGANTLNSTNASPSGYSGFPVSAQSVSQSGLTPRTLYVPGGNFQVQSSSSDIVPGDLGVGSDVNTAVPGHLDIPSLKISAPLMWSTDSKNFDQDLQSGVIHYPGTALPGQVGTTYISGHSSNYVWAKGNYNHVFTHLGDLADNTSFSITAILKNGKTAVFHYVVTGRQQYSPTDPAQFANGGKSTVALSTCWPVGSTAKRLVVFGELTQVEQ